MSLKQRAILEIAQGLAVFSVVATTIYFAPALLVAVTLLGLGVYCLKLVYEVILARLEREEQEKQQQDTKSSS